LTNCRLTDGIDPDNPFPDFSRELIFIGKRETGVTVLTR
jgi:hypothetical protein